MTVDNVYIGDIIEQNSPKYLCLNTNFYVDQHDKAVLLGSVYTCVRHINNNLTQLYGKILKQKKFGVEYIGSANYNFILSFPTRHHWKDQTNIKLFRKSCAELYSLILNKKLIQNVPIYLPIILQNTNTITFDDLIDNAFDVIGENASDIHLVACWGQYN